MVSMAKILFVAFAILAISNLAMSSAENEEDDDSLTNGYRQYLLRSPRIHQPIVDPFIEDDNNMDNKGSNLASIIELIDWWANLLEKEATMSREFIKMMEKWDMENIDVQLTDLNGNSFDYKYV